MILDEREPDVSRRQVLRGMAWSAPVIAAAMATPAHASSDEPSPAGLSITVVSTVLSGDGYTLQLADGKYLNRDDNTNTTNIQTVRFSFRITDSNDDPVAGALVRVEGDEVKDREGNYMIAFAQIGALGPSPAGNFIETATKQLAETSTDLLGEASVKVATATYDSIDRANPAFPFEGSFSIDVTMVTPAAHLRQEFTYRIID